MYYKSLHARFNFEQNRCHNIGINLQLYMYSKQTFRARDFKTCIEIIFIRETEFPFATILFLNDA